MVRRDANHPCVVAWVPFNETWGVRELLTDTSQQAHVAAVVADTRAIDPTRPVVDNSGWTHVDTNIADSHRNLNNPESHPHELGHSTTSGRRRSAPRGGRTAPVCGLTRIHHTRLRWQPANQVKEP